MSGKLNSKGKLFSFILLSTISVRLFQHEFSDNYIKFSDKLLVIINSVMLWSGHEVSVEELPSILN